MTVVLEIPNRSAICAFGTPSPASLRINAQSSKVITLQSLSVHFSSAATVQFSSAVDTEAVNGIIELHRRLARGFRNRDNYRLRMLLAAGGLTP